MGKIITNVKEASWLWPISRSYPCIHLKILWENHTKLQLGYTLTQTKFKPRTSKTQLAWLKIKTPSAN
jgi:hypothetical protein